MNLKKILLQTLKPLIKSVLLSTLKDNKTKKSIIDMINTKIDIPILCEAEEERLLGQIYDAAEEAVVIVIDRY